jgi:type II secretory pathway component PulK
MKPSRTLFENNAKPPQSEQGMALIVVTLVIALATALVVQLAHSTFLSGRSVGMVERQLESEYILKSLINLGITLIDADVSSEVDTRQDYWAVFQSGVAIPPEITNGLGITPPGVIASLEISPLESRFNVNLLGGTVSPNIASSVANATIYAKILRTLFKSLDFDDSLLEPDHTQITPGAVYDSNQLVTVLKDYLDKNPNQESELNPQDGFVDGIEGSGNITEQFKNGLLDSPEELLRVPGFTPNRVRRLSPYITAHRNPGQDSPSPQGINFNFASERLLQSLHDQITPQGGTDLHAKALEMDPQSQEQGYPSPNEVKAKIDSVDPTQQASQELSTASLITVDAQYFRIIAAVEYGAQGTFLAQAVVRHDSSGAEVEFLTLY